MRACGTEARSTLAHSRSSNGKSAAYLVCPVTFPSPSMRGSAFPMVRNAKVHLLGSLSILDFRFPLRCKQKIIAPATSEANPKSEYRNPKQTQRQINRKLRKSETPNPKEACSELYIFGSFEIVSNFGFRASNFLFLVRLRETPLLDDFIRPREHFDWNCQANLFCCFKVNDELKLRRLLYRQLSRFRALEDLVYVVSGAAEQVVDVRPIEHQTAFINKLLLEVNSRQPVFAGKLYDPLSFGEKGASAGSHNCVDLLLVCGLKGVL